MDEPVTPAIISPDPDCLSFEVGGVVYTRTPTLALSRARILQRFQTEMLLDTRLPGLVKSIDETAAALNEGKLLDGLHLFGQLRDKVNLIGANRVREADICGLFYNAPGEDPTAYDFNAQQAKVYEAWAGVDVDFFTWQAYALLLRSPTAYPLPPAAPAAPAPTAGP